MPASVSGTSGIIYQLGRPCGTVVEWSGGPRRSWFVGDLTIRGEELTGSQPVIAHITSHGGYLVKLRGVVLTKRRSDNAGSFTCHFRAHSWTIE